MSNSLETRSTSALFKRAEQLKRWGESDTCREPSERRRPTNNKKKRIQFTDGCVFLAACAAADKEEVERLTERGADIDTANVDGLTALHQVRPGRDPSCPLSGNRGEPSPPFQSTYPPGRFPFFPPV